MSKYHGKVINLSQLHKLQGRDKFMDAKEIAAVDADILAGLPLHFMPNALYEDNGYTREYEKYTYKILLCGVLLDGRNISVVIEGIPVFFDIRLEGRSVATILKAIREFESRTPDVYEALVTRHETLMSKPLKYHQENEEPYLRLFFKNTKLRNKCIDHVRHDQHLETAHDDKSCYYRVVGRDKKLSYCSWMEICDYEVAHISSIKGRTFFVQLGNCRNLLEEETKGLLYRNDKTLLMDWDI